MAKHPSNAEIPATPEAHTPDSCPIAREYQVDQGRREVAKWILGILCTIALGIGGWAHARLASDADRLTRLEAQRDGDRAALDARLSEITRRLDELREIVLRRTP
jgi:hypothetical protein